MTSRYEGLLQDDLVLAETNPDIHIRTPGRLATIIGRTVISLGLATGLLIDTGSNESVSHDYSHASIAEFDVTAYPWADAEHVPMPPATDNITWGYTNKTTCDEKSASYNCGTFKRGDYFVYDQWNFYIRNCTSYMAWLINKKYGVNVAGWKDAGNWDNAAAAAGHSVDGSPEVGDVAVWNGTQTNTYGHVAYVLETRTKPDGSIDVRVAESNQGWDGNITTNRWTRADQYIDLNGPDSVPPPVVVKKPNADINRDGNDDLLLMSHDPDGAVGANVGLSTNAGFWFQSQWWRDRYTDFAPMKPFIGDVTGDGKADLTYLIPTAQGSQAWVVPSTTIGFDTPQLWWNGVGYQFDGIKAAMGDIDKNGAKDLILFTRQSAAGGLAISAALSTHTGFWLRPPWHTDSFTDWNRTQVFAPDVNGDGAADPTLLVATPEGTDAWVQLSQRTSLSGPQRWWHGAGYQFDGIKAVAGDVDANGADDLLLVTNQGPGGDTAVSPLLSTYGGFWLRSPWWTDIYTDWNHMTPIAGNFTGRRANPGRIDERPIIDFGFVAPTTNGVRTWVLPSTTTGFTPPQSWAILDGWGYGGVKVAQS